MKSYIQSLLIAIFTIGFTACSSDNELEEIQDPNKVKVTFVYTLNTSNSGTMSRATTNEEVFNEFYAKITSGELVAPSYSLTLTEVNTGVVYTFNGNWNSHDLITLNTGTYSVVGTSTADGANIQDKCSFTFNEQIEISATSNVITLHANYDCFLLIFNNSQIESLENNNGSTQTSFYTFENYRYAFVNDKLFIEEQKNNAYILGKYTDNAEFKVFTGNLNFEKGKYYVYNSVSNGYDVPPMEEGGVTSGDLSVETYILDNTTHPYYIGGRIHNNNESIVKKGIIVSTDKDNLIYNEEIAQTYYGLSNAYYFYDGCLQYKVIECTNCSNEQFNIPLTNIYGSTKYYIRAFVQNNDDIFIYGNTIEVVSDNFNREDRERYDYSNVWYSFGNYTLFDLVTDEYIDYSSDGFYYSTNENPHACYYQSGISYNSCYKFKTEWNYKLWYYNHAIHCNEYKIVSTPTMEYKNGKLHINKQEKDADKNIEIYYSINENGRRPETFTNKYDAPLEINVGDVVYCYAISEDGYISYTNIYKRFPNQ
jgi:hypothetical protein